MERKAQAAYVLCVLWISGELNPEYLFTNKTIPGNTRNNFVESIFSNAAFLIGGINKE